MAESSVSKPVTSVGDTHDRAFEASRYDRIEDARGGGPREHPKRRKAPPRPSPPARDDDRHVGTRLDVVA